MPLLTCKALNVSHRTDQVAGQIWVIVCWCALWSALRVSRECYHHVENFQRCFVHRYRLNFCDEDLVNKLLACQARYTSHVLM